jgi:hypothetical protein
MPDSKGIENHKPLLDENQVTRLDGLSDGLNLTTADDQAKFLVKVAEGMRGISVDHILEYLVNNRDVLLGNVIPAVRLSQKCNTARRIHWGAEQMKRHKARNGQLVATQVSKEMAGSRA